MDFDALLAQVRELLQRQGRVSYRALKLRFQIDDEALAALRDEIIYAERVARDEEDRVLVWVGAADTTSEPAGRSSAARPPNTPPAESRALEAERRQLTVLFCDLVGSTQLSGQLDPEDLRTVVRAYQEAAAEVMQPYEGYIAQYLGDGLLVYFGYPLAHEDDAQRAVRAGLGILEAMDTLNTQLAQDKNRRLAVRIGIHTGLVVVGEMGGGGRQEHLALGETPNVAARLQGLATPDTIVISAATRRLVQGYFTMAALGPQTLKGVASPIPVYRILGASTAQSRLEATVPSQLTPLVGRDEDVALLSQRWEQAKAGQGQVVLLSGEAGIGKSRLAQVLKDQVAAEPHARIEWWGSLYHQQSPLSPVIDQLHRLLRWHQEAPRQEHFQQLEALLARSGLALPEVVPLVAALLSLPLPAHYPVLTMTPQRQRQKTLDTLVTWLYAEARRQPVLVIVEDLHWIDPSTLELLSLLIEQGANARLCLVLTARPEFHPPWAMVSHLTALTLRRFAPAQVTRLATHVAGDKTLPSAMLEEVVRKTDGVPLFVEELTKMVLESGLLQEREDHYDLTGPLPPLAIPATLHDALMARLDRLAAAKLVAQLGAAIGRTFPYDLVQAVVPLDEATLQWALAQLVEADLVAQRGLPPLVTYTFKHALIQDVAYQSLLRSTRQHYHQRIAQTLEAQFPETAEAQPELLAHHYMEAGLTEPSVVYWYKAAQRAVERSAHAEAIAHLTQGLALLQTLPETRERLQREVDLQIALGASLIATKGHADPEVGQCYTRARDLCHSLDDHHRLFPVLRGLWNGHGARGELQMAHDLGKQLLTLAEQVQDAAMLCAAHRALGSVLFSLGAPASAHTHFTQGIACDDLQQHRSSVFLYGEDAGVICHSRGAWALWCLGYPDQGLARSHEAVMLAQQRAHPLSICMALSEAARFHQFRREVHAAQTHVEAALRLATDQGFPLYLAYGSILRGWAFASQGHAQEGLAQLHQGVIASRATGAETFRPYFLALLADVHGVRGQPTAGLAALAEALAHAENTGERWYEPELYRLKGALLVQQSSDHHTEAETCFAHAMAIASNQSAKSWELRAATSLSRLWQQQGRRTDAYQLLAPVYGWFTEGFDTADLQEAKALLEGLS